MNCQTTQALVGTLFLVTLLLGAAVFVLGVMLHRAHFILYRMGSNAEQLQRYEKFKEEEGQDQKASRR